LLGKSQGLEVGFGLFRVMLTLPTLKHKELAAELDGNLAAKMKLHIFFMHSYK